MVHDWLVYLPVFVYCQDRFIDLTKAVDPDSLNPDQEPALQVNTDPDPIRIQGFDDQKLRKKIQLKIFFNLFFQNLQFTCPYASWKGRSSYRRSLQPLKENIQHFKKLNLLIFFLCVRVNFALLRDSGSGLRSGYGSRDPIESGSITLEVDLSNGHIIT